MPAITVDQYNEIIARTLPFARIMGFQPVSINDDQTVIKAVYNASYLRSGGTISGPVMMGLADVAAYAVVLSKIGSVESAVTTQLNINFLNKPQQADLIAKAHLLKLGKRLAVVEVHLYSAVDRQEILVAHATATFSLPPM